MRLYSFVKDFVKLSGKAGRNYGARQKNTGSNSGAHKYIKVTRLVKVTIYRRAKTYWLYYRDQGRSIRQHIDGNLATAKATASHINMYLEQKRPSPFDFTAKPIGVVITEFLDHCRLGRGLRIKTLRRYDAALNHFQDFIATCERVRNVDQIKPDTIEAFIRYLSQKQRSRCGSPKGSKGSYTTSGIAFIVSTCRTLFNYAHKQRLLSPYEDNPFSHVAIDKLRNREPSSIRLLAIDQLKAFFQACDDWQFSLFFLLSLYGLRVGELTHLLISEIDVDQEQFTIQSKPFLQWYVKTNRKRVLPIIPAVKSLFIKLKGERREGFLFLSRAVVKGKKTVPGFTNPTELKSYLQEQLARYTFANTLQGEKDRYNRLRAILHGMGKIREDHIRHEFMQITAQIDQPEITTVHSLRHLFATLAEENGLNPLTVQTILGHSRLEMTRYYTHTGLEAKKLAVEGILQGKNGFEQILDSRQMTSDHLLSDGKSTLTDIRP